MIYRPLKVSSYEVHRLEELAQARARESFLDFRRYIRPQLKVGWWVREIARALQRFCDDLPRRQAAKACANGSSSARKIIGSHRPHRICGRP